MTNEPTITEYSDESSPSVQQDINDDNLTISEELLVFYKLFNVTYRHAMHYSFNLLLKAELDFPKFFYYFMNTKKI